MASGIKIELTGEVVRSRVIEKHGEVIGCGVTVKTARESNGRTYSSYYSVTQWGANGAEMAARLRAGVTVKVEAYRVEGRTYAGKDGTQKVDINLTASRVLVDAPDNRSAESSGSLQANINNTNTEYNLNFDDEPYGSVDIPF